MRRSLFLMVVGTTIFLSLMLATGAAGAEELPGSDVYVIGQHAYVAAGTSGLIVVDIRPANPKQVAAVQTPGAANGVFAISSFAYVAVGSAGLLIIDVRKPVSPKILGSIDTPGDARNVYGLANTFYVAGLGFGFGVFDVINRARLNTPGKFLVNLDR